MEWAALITWVMTAGVGVYMLTTWARAGGARPAAGSASNFPPPVVFGHFLLAAAGLVVWIIYLATDNDTLTWVAFADLVIVAVIGDLLILRWLRDRRAPTASRGTHNAEQEAVPAAATPMGSETALAEQHIPLAVVATHGVFAVATIVLVLLVALGVGT
ncbi:hypothetical protein [Nocardioides sp.]|uniref:hypothetical protein n=1 Tax=Nocardioides sp. TaxID=35761 RepID=UPI002F4004CA